MAASGIVIEDSACIFEELNLNEDELLKLWEENYFENEDENFNQYLVEIEASTLAKRLHFLNVSILLDGLFVVSSNKGEQDISMQNIKG